MAALSPHARLNRSISGHSDIQQGMRSGGKSPANRSRSPAPNSLGSGYPTSSCAHGPDSLFPPEDDKSFAHAPRTLAEEPSGPVIQIDPAICEQTTHLGHAGTANSRLLEPSPEPPTATLDPGQVVLIKEDERFITTEAHFAGAQQPETRLFFRQRYQSHQESPIKVTRSQVLTNRGKLRTNAAVTSVTCNICKKKRPTLQKMARHLKEHMNLKGKYVCDQPLVRGEFCTREYGDKQDLDRHLRGDHGEQKRSPNQHKKTTSKQATSIPSPELANAPSTSASADGAFTNDTSETGAQPKEKRRRSWNSIISSLPHSKKRKLQGDSSPNSPDPPSLQYQVGPVAFAPQPTQEYDPNDQLVDPVHLSYALDGPAVFSEPIHDTYQEHNLDYLIWCEGLCKPWSLEL